MEKTVEDVLETSTLTEAEKQTKRTEAVAVKTAAKAKTTSVVTLIKTAVETSASDTSASSGGSVLESLFTSLEKINATNIQSEVAETFTMAEAETSVQVNVAAFRVGKSTSGGLAINYYYPLYSEIEVAELTSSIGSATRYEFDGLHFYMPDGDDITKHLGPSDNPYTVDTTAATAVSGYYPLYKNQKLGIYISPSDNVGSVSIAGTTYYYPKGIKFFPGTYVAGGLSRTEVDVFVTFGSSDVEFASSIGSASNADSVYDYTDLRNLLIKCGFKNVQKWNTNYELLKK